MVRGLVRLAQRYINDWTVALFRDRVPAPALFVPPGPKAYRPLQRVVLTADVQRTLFDDYAAHRQGERGEEEIGWVLLGVREEDEVVAVAALPAGADRQAGVAHVQFNSNAQAIGARYVRQIDRRLGMVGVVHTHPGSLRHPSDGDYQGDSLWVGQLRGGEGVFGIGTADVRGNTPARAAHMQVDGELCFSWYALGGDDTRYRRLPLEIRPGPDLARSLQPLWETIEAYADALDALSRQLAKVVFDVVAESAGPALVLNIPLTEPGAALRVLLHKEQVRYYQIKDDTPAISLEAPDTELSRAVYLLLADLARPPARPLARAGR